MMQFGTLAKRCALALALVRVHLGGSWPSTGVPVSAFGQEIQKINVLLLIKLYGTQPGYVESRASSSGCVESFRLRFLDFRICFFKSVFLGENRCLVSWDQNKILVFFLIFLFFVYMGSQASKTLKIESGRSKSPGGLI